MCPVSAARVLLLLFALALLCAAPVSASAAPTCEAGSDLSVPANQLGGYVVYGTVSGADYYHWDVWDDGWVTITDCAVPVGPNGEADLVLSAGQLALGMHELQLVATILVPTPNAGYSCGGHAVDTTNLDVLYSPVPVIESVWIGRGRDTSPEGEVSYHERMVAQVSDTDGDIASVLIADPQGNLHDAYFQTDLGDWRWEVYGEESPAPAGTYTLTVTDAQGYVASLSAQTSAIPDTTALILSPPANDSIASATPTFSWSGPGDVCYCLGVYEVDGPCAIWCGGRYVEDPEGLALYNDNGGAAQSELTSGHLYGWYATAMLPDPIEQSDPRCTSEFNPIASGRFWVEPKFVGFLDPINDDGSSIFRLGATVPVKFQLIAADGSQVTDASCQLHVAKVTDDITGTYVEAVSARAAGSGGSFRYVADHYQFNLATKVLSQGTYRLRVTVNGAIAHETTISVK
jgi:hypothetical protein